MWQPQSQPDWPTKAENALTNVSGYRVNGSQVTSPDLSPTVTSSAIDTYSALPSCYIPISPTLSSCHLEMWITLWLVALATWQHLLTFLGTGRLLGTTYSVNKTLCTRLL